MIELLGNAVSDWVIDASDWVAINWTIILAWLAIPTSSIALIATIGKFINNLIQRKTFTKYVQPLQDKYQELLTLLTTMANEINENNRSQMETYITQIQNQLNSFAETLNATRQQLFKDVFNENPEETITVEPVHFENPPKLEESTKTEEVQEQVEADKKSKKEKPQEKNEERGFDR